MLLHLSPNRVNRMTTTGRRLPYFIDGLLAGELWILACRAGTFYEGGQNSSSQSACESMAAKRIHEDTEKRQVVSL